MSVRYTVVVLGRGSAFQKDSNAVSWRTMASEMGVNYCSSWTSPMLWCFLRPGQVQENDTSSEELATKSVGSHKASDSGPRENARKFDGNIRKTGGWKTTPFIFGNELCERLAAFGLSINLVTFLILEMHMPTVKAATIITNFGGTAGLTPLVGAFIADAYLGRFKTIAISSVIYMVGVVFLTISAVLPFLRPPVCSYHFVLSGTCKQPTNAQMWYFYAALFLLAIGSGGIRPSVAAFGADQFNIHDPKEKHQLWHFFNWYYFSIGLSILGAVTVIVYIQDNVGWAWGFGVPAIAMAFALISFFVGAPMYRHMAPSGSPFTRFAQVILASFRKRKLSLPSDASMLHTREDKEVKGGLEQLRHTDQFTFLDKAAIEDEGDKLNGSSAVSPWRLCTVHQIEEFKSLLRMAPIWATTILVSTVIVQQGTFSVQQGRSMDRDGHYVTMERYMGRFQIPAASLGVFGILMLLFWVPIYDLVLMKWLKKATGKERGLTSLQRIGIGLVLAIIAMVAAAAIEAKRRNAAHQHGLLDHPDETIPISAFWLVPQYCLFGLAESFVIIGELEFFYEQSPESLRSTGTALFWSTMAIGSYISSFIVIILNHKTDWLNNNLNRAHLDYFYWFLAILSTCNFVFFILASHWFRYRPEPEAELETV